MGYFFFQKLKLRIFSSVTLSCLKNVTIFICLFQRGFVFLLVENKVTAGFLHIEKKFKNIRTSCNLELFLTTHVQIQL